MSQINETLINAEKFFNRIAIDEERLVSTIPELIGVIKDLYTIRESRNKTRDYIETWRRTKFKLTCNRTLANRDVVEVDVSNPDMTAHDMYTEWLFMYLYNLYKNKTEKTIGYAYALEILTQIHNSRKGNIYIVGLPNTVMNDVLDIIEAERSINYRYNDDNDDDENVNLYTTKHIPENIEEINYDKYSFKIEYVISTYIFCIDTNVFDQKAVSKMAFLNAVKDADFTMLHTNAEKKNTKTKLKYIIYKFSEIINENKGSEWYIETAHSIKTEPTRCSAVNVPIEWKSSLNMIFKKR